MSVLASICAAKRDFVAKRKRERPLSEVETAAKIVTPPRGFAHALWLASITGNYGLIAEIKRASPSSGLIRADFDPASLARAYAAGGATCLSVLTDEPYFQGEDTYLTAARATVELPVVRKDFLLDPYQIIESRALGADAVLVILAAVDDGCARELIATATEFGMSALVEVHDEREMERAVALDAALIGINNRNLATLSIDLMTTERLAPMAPPDRVLISESGLYSGDHLRRMARVGVHCFLIGESLMRQPDVQAATRELLTRRTGIAGFGRD